MTVTPPKMLPPMWYRLKSSRFLLIESSWSGNRVIILANDSSRPTKGGIQVIINGIVIANTVECVLAEDPQVLVLTTCSSEFTDARTVILAFMEPSTVREDVRNIK